MNYSDRQNCDLLNPLECLYFCDAPADIAAHVKPSDFSGAGDLGNEPTA
jgi:hypothetical protein